jgi:hypothetical protein
VSINYGAGNYPEIGGYFDHLRQQWSIGLGFLPTLSDLATLLANRISLLQLYHVRHQRNSN